MVKPPIKLGMTRTKKKKRKKITIDIGESLMEGNFMEIPFAVMNRKADDIGTLEIKWVDSNNVARNLKVVASNESNLPTAKDMNVLVGLFKLYSEQNSVIEINGQQRICNTLPIRIHFTFAELTRTLGYKTIGGSVIKQLQKSIETLSLTSLISENGLYDASTRTYVNDTKKIYKILEMQIYTYKDNKDKKRLSPEEIKQNNFVEISPFFYNSMLSGNFGIFNYNLWRTFKRDISKKLYLILNKWDNDKRPFVFYEYKSLYSMIPLDDESVDVSTKNRYIRRSAQDMKECGYIKDYKAVPNKGVFFIFDDSIDIDFKNMEDNYCVLDDYKNNDEVLYTLADYGVPDEIIKQYVKNETIHYAEALLRYFDTAMRYNRIKKNPTGFLIQGLREPYNIPEKYYRIVNEDIKIRNILKEYKG